MTIDKQVLRQLATDAQELGIIKRYTKGIEANKRFVAIATPLTVLALLDELEAAQKQATQQGNIAVELFDEVTRLQRSADDKAPELREQLEAAEKRIAEHRKVLNSLAAVARRYLPDYDEHPEIQAADELLESAAGIGVKGE
ncbi:ead/Ea22-like family protein [Citrobacter portucalensis]|uniref:ead/Ea22-like family protein n=1 Tax=Citrobacter portucalensis TaxID=1639133 RepID=UPI001BD0D1E5|nr:ead/Ea22-like family protein [Citrobacter portucalensis]